MESESNAGFHRQQVMLFDSGGVMSNGVSSGSGGCEMISVGSYYGNPGGNLNLAVDCGGMGSGMILSPGTSQNSLGSPLLLSDSVPGLKHDTGLAAEWSVEEQYMLEEGLRIYGNEPNIMAYVKIAAPLRNKTVRDVALRCRWMVSQQRKHEDQSLGKKVKDRKDKLVDSIKNSGPSASLNTASSSFLVNKHDQRNLSFSEAMSGAARHLLAENNQAFDQISENLSALKLQENIGLLFHARNNITSILNDMSNMPGIMSQMPPLPVFLNDELASSVFPCPPQCMMFGSSNLLHLKEEPRY